MDIIIAGDDIKGRWKFNRCKWAEIGWGKEFFAGRESETKRLWYFITLKTNTKHSLTRMDAHSATRQGMARRKYVKKRTPGTTAVMGNGAGYGEEEHE